MKTFVRPRGNIDRYYYEYLAYAGDRYVHLIGVEVGEGFVVDLPSHFTSLWQSVFLNGKDLIQDYNCSLEDMMKGTHLMLRIDSHAQVRVLTDIHGSLNWDAEDIWKKDPDDPAKGGLVIVGYRDTPERPPQPLFANPEIEVISQSHHITSPSAVMEFPSTQLYLDSIEEYRPIEKNRLYQWLSDNHVPIPNFADRGMGFGPPPDPNKIYASPTRYFRFVNDEATQVWV